MTQKAFTFAQDEILPSDTHVTEAKEVSRLTGQNSAILARLRKGPATARELASLSLKYTSRISDLRKAGYVVQCDESHAVSIYRLQEGQ